MAAEQRAEGQGQWTDVCMMGLWLFRDKWSSFCWLADDIGPEHGPDCSRPGEEKRVSLALHSILMPSAVFSFLPEKHIQLSGDVPFLHILLLVSRTAHTAVVLFIYFRAGILLQFSGYEFTISFIWEHSARMRQIE